MADKNNVGRPRIFESAKEMHNKIEEYFEWCDEQVREYTDKKGNIHIIYKPYTVSGLCLYLGMTRETLCQYEKKEGFSDTIKNAKNRIENWVEEHSLTGELNPAVSIFNLKNNFGWTDKQEIESKNTNTNINTDISDLPPEALEEIAKAQGQEEVMRIVGKYRK
jgi:hypothetical protein